MPSGIKNLFLLFVLSLLLAGFTFVPGKIILQTDEDPVFFLNERTYLKKLEIKTLILSNLTLAWNDSPDILIKQRKTLNTLKNNSLNVYMRIDLNEDLPKWDDPDWVNVNNSIKKIISEAKASGIQGVIINTDTGRLWSPAYNPNQLWNPDFNMRYKDISDSFAEQIIYQRGREIAQAIKDAHPRIEIAVYPVGPAEPVSKNYTYWHHFVNGMLSTKQQIQLIANAQNTQSVQAAAQSVENLLDSKTISILPLFQSKNTEPYNFEELQNNYTSYILPYRFHDLLQLLGAAI